MIRLEVKNHFPGRVLASPPHHLGGTGQGQAPASDKAALRTPSPPIPQPTHLAQPLDAPRVARISSLMAQRSAGRTGEASSIMSQGRNHAATNAASHPLDAPCCPGCGGTLELNQPDSRRPSQLLGTCPRARCGEWVALTRFERRWRIVGRISASSRRSGSHGDIWPVARPTAPTTALRSRA